MRVGSREKLLKAGRNYYGVLSPNDNENQIQIKTLVEDGGELKYSTDDTEFKSAVPSATLQQIETNSTDISTLQTDIEELGNELNSTKSEITQLSSSVVELTGDQTIAGQKTFTDDITLKNADGTDKSITITDASNNALLKIRGSQSGNLGVINSNTLFIRNRLNTNNGIVLNPSSTIRPEQSESISLGAENYLFSDLYLAGNLTDGTNSISVADIVNSGSSGVGKKISVKPSIKNNWTAKTWNVKTSFEGREIWTDGNNIYCSSDTDQYVLDTATSTWNTKTWNGLKNLIGYGIWTDGNNIYYSYIDNRQYVLDTATSTWNTKTWNGLKNPIGMVIWTDGNNIYYSYGTDQYVLDTATSTWNTKTWNGLNELTSFSGNNIWTDGNNIYFSRDTDHYVLDTATSTWNTKTWNGLTSFSGNNIWTDGNNIYYSYITDQYVLDTATSTWNTKTWNGLTSFFGNDGIWTDGNNIYYSRKANHYVLKSIQIQTM